VIFMVGQPGIVHPLNLRVFLQNVGDLKSVLTDSIHAQRDGFNTLQNLREHS